MLHGLQTRSSDSAATADARRPDAKVAPPLVIAALQRGGGTAAGGISPQPPTAALEPGADAPGVIDPSVAILYLGPTGHRSRSRTFTIHAEARTLAGGLFARRAVVRMAVRGEPPFSILAWGRGEAALFPAASR